MQGLVQLVGLEHARGVITSIALGTVAGSTVQCGSLDGAAHTGIRAAIASDTSYLKSYG